MSDCHAPLSFRLRTRTPSPPSAPEDHPVRFARFGCVPLPLGESPKRGRASAGFSLLEVTISVAILVLAVSGTIGAILVSSNMNERAKHEMAAAAAAEDMMAQVREAPFTSILAAFNGRTFTVEGLPNPAPGLPHGEVILIASETPSEAAYGRNLGVPGGGPGVDLNANGSTADLLPPGAFGVDIDGDGLFTTAAVTQANLKLLPVVILVRWNSGEGIQRLQVMTMVVNRAP